MRNFIMLILVSLTAISCSDDGRTENNERYNDLSAWWNENTDDVNNETREGWEQFKENYKSMRDSVKVELLTDEQRAEYDRMDEEVAERDEELNQRWAEKESLPAESPTPDPTLLGGADLVNMEAGQLRDTYIAFMERVRAADDQWVEADWDRAEVTFQQLQDVRDRLSNGLSTTDKAKIAALETEFRTLETASDVETAVD